MHKLFVGNLPPTTTPHSLTKAFQRLQVEVISVAIRKGGYAFVDVADQNAADRAIEMFKSRNRILLLCIILCKFLQFP